MVQFMVRPSSRMRFPQAFRLEDVLDGTVADYLYSLCNSWEIAIEGSSWCELATIGSEFECEDFIIEVDGDED